MNNIETLILQYLIYNSEYFETVVNYMDYRLFESTPHKIILKTILTHFKEEETRIPYDILGVKLNQIKNISAELVQQIKDVYKLLVRPESNDIDSLIKETEKYIKQRKTYNVISTGVEEFDKNGEFSDSYLSEAEDAITFSFDNSVGYDYLANMESRFQIYKENVIKYPVSIAELNKKTNGGIEQKTINCVVSSTGGGKSVWLCQEAAYNVMQGKNVLYITLEMSEIQISKRIDANILNRKQDDFATMSDNAGKMMMKQLKQKSMGQLIIKEFPADSITALDIKKVIEQLKRKKKINIDILIVDYLGLMGSYRYSTKNNNSYSIGKHATEELRSLAVLYNIPIWTAIQFNRGAENAEAIKQMGLGNVSDSYGIPMGMDFMFSIMHTSELDGTNKSVFRILKNRYGESKNDQGMFTVLHDWGCAKFFDDPHCQESIPKDDSNSKAMKDFNKNEKLEKEKEEADNNNVITVTDYDLF